MNVDFYIEKAKKVFPELYGYPFNKHDIDHAACLDGIALEIAVADIERAFHANTKRGPAYIDGFRYTADYLYPNYEDFTKMLEEENAKP